mmetsp:Transcript_27051/g.83328  ORF Transcript_27051/g.83328 Transcript_27051/m.83328 type:complete len:317 (+) Transcript_27051:1000-1950(+)
MSASTQPRGRRHFSRASSELSGGASFVASASAHAAGSDRTRASSASVRASESVANARPSARSDVASAVASSGITLAARYLSVLPSRTHVASTNGAGSASASSEPRSSTGQRASAANWSTWSRSSRTSRSVCAPVTACDASNPNTRAANVDLRFGPSPSTTCNATIFKDALMDLRDSSSASSSALSSNSVPASATSNTRVPFSSKTRASTVPPAMESNSDTAEMSTSSEGALPPTQIVTSRGAVASAKPSTDVSPGGASAATALPCLTLTWKRLQRFRRANNGFSPNRSTHARAVTASCGGCAWSSFTRTSTRTTPA